MTENHTFSWHALSEEEQEILVGGLGENILGTSNFFFQKTDIQTQADNNLSLGEEESSSQTSKYSFSQITMASSITFKLPIFLSHGNNVNHIISEIIRGLFS